MFEIEQLKTFIKICLGIILALIVHRLTKKEIKIYPTMDNYDKLMFIDNSNVCYRYYPQFI